MEKCLLAFANVGACWQNIAEMILTSAATERRLVRTLTLMRQTTGGDVAHSYHSWICRADQSVCLSVCLFIYILSDFFAFIFTSYIQCIVLRVVVCVEMSDVP